MSRDDEAAQQTMGLWWRISWRPILSEFLSTLMLVLFGCMACIPVKGINTAINAPFGFGFVVLFNIQIFGHISGAYMNPAITLASVIWGHTTVSLGVVFVLAEFAGALVGYGILLNLTPVNVMTERVCVTAPHVGINDLQALGIEIALTAALTIITCALWDPVNASKQDSVPIKFGLTIVGLSLVGGPLTGASMNPARTFAPAVWTGFWAHQWVYWVGPCVGSLIAVLFYKLVFLKKRESD